MKAEPFFRISLPLPVVEPIQLFSVAEVVCLLSPRMGARFPP